MSSPAPTRPMKATELLARVRRTHFGRLASPDVAPQHAVGCLLDTQEAAHWLHISHRTLERWRSTGSGPKFHKFGRRVIYRSEDVVEWIATRLRTSTSDLGRAGR